MPKIFSKDCKIKVIEYGESSKSTLSWNEFKAQIQDLIPTENILKIIKRAS